MPIYKNNRMTSLPFTSMWNERSIILELALNLTRNRYQGSYIGFLWVILEPLLAFGVLYMVFSTIRSNSGSEYAVYLFSGLVIFQVFSRGTQHGLTSLRGNEGIINSLKVNREVFPLAATISSMFMLGIQFGIFFVFAIILNHEFSASLVFMPIIFVLMYVLNLGLSYLFSIIFVYVKDIQPIWNIFSYALFFVSPIFWHVKEIDGILLTIYELNPLGRIIELNHSIVFGNNLDLINLGITSLYVVSIWIVGYVIFKKAEQRVAEEL